MDIPGVAIVAGGVALCLLIAVVVEAIGQALTDEARDAIFRRPGFAVRRHRYRRLLISGSLAGVLAGLAGFVWLAAATSSDPAHARDARILAAITCSLVATAAGLLTAWWRLVGRSRR